MTNNTIFDGEVGVGTNDITSPLNIGGTGCMIIPSGTTGQRPTAVTGKIRFNTTIHKFEGRASDWHPLSDEDLPPLYAFTSHTFTNGGQTGRTGPSLSQLRTAYASESWELNTNFFNIKAGSYTGFQLWTVPVTGTYSIEAKGASGGFGDTTSKLPGRGAHIKANFVLTKSTKIVIIVGQAGSSQTGRTNNVGGGGGGATWVLKDVANAPFASLNDVYMAAGGGAGGHAYTGTISRTADANGGSNASASSSSGTPHITLVVVRGTVELGPVRQHPTHRVASGPPTRQRVGIVGTKMTEVLITDDTVVLVVGVVTGHTLLVAVVGIKVDRHNIGLQTLWPPLVRHIFHRAGTSRPSREAWYLVAITVAFTAPCLLRNYKFLSYNNKLNHDKRQYIFRKCWYRNG